MKSQQAPWIYQVIFAFLLQLCTKHNTRWTSRPPAACRLMQRPHSAVCSPRNLAGAPHIALQVKPDALAISLVKGMHVSRDGPQLISQMIRR